METWTRRYIAHAFRWRWTDTALMAFLVLMLGLFMLGLFGVA